MKYIKIAIILLFSLTFMSCDTVATFRSAENTVEKEEVTTEEAPEEEKQKEQNEERKEEKKEEREEGKKEKVIKNALSTMANVSPERLHDSDYDKDDYGDIPQVDDRYLKAVDSPLLKEAQKCIARIHMRLEVELYNKQNLEAMRHPDNTVWQKWSENKMEAQRTDNIPLRDLLLADLSFIEKAYLNQDIAEDLDFLGKLIINGVDNKDLSCLWYAHSVAHDLDYWVINRNRNNQDSFDKAGTGVYFGATKTLEKKYIGIFSYLHDLTQHTDREKYAFLNNKKLLHDEAYYSYAFVERNYPYIDEIRLIVEKEIENYSAVSGYISNAARILDMISLEEFTKTNFYIGNCEEAKRLLVETSPHIKNELLIQDMEEATALLDKAIKNKDALSLSYADMIVHDLNYFVINLESFLNNHNEFNDALRIFGADNNFLNKRT